MNMPKPLSESICADIKRQELAEKILLASVPGFFHDFYYPPKTNDFIGSEVFIPVSPFDFHAENCFSIADAFIKAENKEEGTDK